MAEKLARLTHRVAIQLHLMSESCTICSTCFRRSVCKLLDKPRTCTIQWKSLSPFLFLHKN